MDGSCPFLSIISSILNVFTHRPDNWWVKASMHRHYVYSVLKQKKQESDLNSHLPLHLHSHSHSHESSWDGSRRQIALIFRQTCFLILTLRWAVVVAKSIYHNTVPPTINYVTPDPDCDLDYVPNLKRDMVVNGGMSTNLGFGGHNAALLFKKFEE